MSLKKKWLKVAAALIAAPVLLVGGAAILLYIPPVQNWAAQQVASIASEKTGKEISVGKVRLEFPLDLGIDDFKMIDGKDTIADIGHLTLDVQMKPLLKKKVVIDALEIDDAKVNTTDLIDAARVKGTLGKLSLRSDGIDLDKETIQLNDAKISQADVQVVLNDSVPEDTTKSETKWKIIADKLTIDQSKVNVHLPGDTLQIDANIGNATAENANVDLEERFYSVEHFNLKAGTLDYNNRFEPKVDGLDTNHLALKDISISADSFYCHGDDIGLTLRNCSMKEKSGLEISELNGNVQLDSTRIDIQHIKLKTPDSNVEGEVSMEWSTLDKNNPGRAQARLMAQIGKQDVMRMAGRLPKQFTKKYPNQPISIRGSVNGNMQEIDFTGLEVKLPTAFELKTTGRLTNPTDPKRMAGKLHIDAKTENIDFITDMADLGDVKIPKGIKLNGDVAVNGQHYAADFKAQEGSGTVDGKAKIDLNSKTYEAKLNVNNLQVHDFLPKDSIYKLSATINAQGKGFDPTDKKSWMNANADIKHLGYGHWNIDDVKAKANLKNGKAHADIDSHNPLLDGHINLDALLSKKKLDATFSADINKIDLQRLRLSEKPLTTGLCAHLDVASDMDEYYKIQGTISDATVIDRLQTYRPEDIYVDAQTSKDTTWAKLSSGSLNLDLTSSSGYKELIEKGTKLAEEIVSQKEEKRIDQPKLKEMLPNLQLHLKSKTDNPLAQVLKMQKDISYDDVMIDLDSSPITGLNGSGYAYGINADSTLIDTVRFHIKQDSTRLAFDAQIRNNKQNPQFTFNALLDGTLTERGAQAGIRVFDDKEKLGLRIGAVASMEENGINLHLLPEKPTIGYREFTLNKDNFIFFDQNNRMSAKVDLLADDGTGIKLYSTDENADALQDLTLSINKLDLERTLEVLPFMPAISGTLNGDYHVVQSSEGDFSIMSDMSVNHFTYEQQPIGNIGTEFVYMPKSDGSHFIDGTLKSEGEEVATINGTYKKDDGGIIDANIGLMHFPLSIVNGFIPDRIMGFKGYADGDIALKGKTSKPQANGTISLDSAYLISDPYGIEMSIATQPLNIASSNLVLDNFKLYSHNDNPLTVNGNVNFADLDHIKTNLKLQARNFLLIDAKENPRSVAYGQAYVNFFGNVKGELDMLSFKGKLDVLGSTDMTYILRDSPLTTDNQLNELVEFTDFSDTTSVVAVKRPKPNGLTMDLMISIDEQARIYCALNADKSNYVDLEGGGDLRMQYDTVDDLKLTGRYTLGGGKMKYSLPVIPLKTFTIQDGSYIEFTGDPYNPRLNITATERTKASVAEDNGASRSVAFDCGIIVSQTLNDMGLEFIIDAPEDMSVKSELDVMSVEQRGKLAVSMLTTGMYLADGNTSAFSMNSALSTFLQSEINNITGNALKTLDFTVGLDNTTDATGAMHTDYSFNFAKRFWNNRLTINVGGKVTSGDNSGTGTTSNNSFLDNVTFEYRLSQSSNQYLKLFYDRSTYDYFEGDIGKYGGGFIWKRKLQNIKDIFNLKNPVTLPPNDSIRKEDER